MTRKLDKICEATVGRHGSKGSAGLWSLREGKREGSPGSPAFCMKALLNHSQKRGAQAQDDSRPCREYGDWRLGDWGQWVLGHNIWERMDICRDKAKKSEQESLWVCHGTTKLHAFGEIS